MHGNYYPLSWLLNSVATSYLLLMVSGVGLAIVRRTSRGRLKALFMNAFLFSSTAMSALLVVLVFSRDGRTNWLAFWISLALWLGFCTTVIVWQFRHPVDWSKPFNKSGLVSEERAVLSSAMKKLWYGKGPSLTAAEKAAIDAAIERLK